MTDFTVDVLDQIKALDLEEYQEYLKVYQAGDKTETNGERGSNERSLPFGVFMHIITEGK